MVSHKEGVQNNVNKNESLCRAWREGASAGVCDLPTVLQASRE